MGGQEERHRRPVGSSFARTSCYTLDGATCGHRRSRARVARGARMGRVDVTNDPPVTESKRDLIERLSAGET